MAQKEFFIIIIAADKKTEKKIKIDLQSPVQCPCALFLKSI
jgi:hypothetical protein